MIKSNITVEVNSTKLGGVLIVPSAVFTSTVQEEELDLTKTPNFQIVIGKGDEIKDTVEVSFTAEEVEYTANMKVVNRNGSTVTLQYVDGLTAEDAPEPEPTPEEPTCSDYIYLSESDSYGGDTGAQTNGVFMGAIALTGNAPGWTPYYTVWRASSSSGESPNIIYKYCPCINDSEAINVKIMRFNATGTNPSGTYGYNTEAECAGRLEVLDLSSYYEEYPELEALHITIDEWTYQLSNGKYVPQYEIVMWSTDDNISLSTDLFEYIINQWDTESPIYLLSYKRGTSDTTVDPDIKTLKIGLMEYDEDNSKDIFVDTNITVGYDKK